MKLSDIMTPELTLCHGIALSKKKIFELISQTISEADDRLKYHHILRELQQREQLGSTAIGHGVAIPHCRLPSLKRSICVLISLEEPISYDDSNPDTPVDLVFGLIAPEKDADQHIELLSILTDQLQHSHYRDTLRQANNNLSLYQAATAHST